MRCTMYNIDFYETEKGESDIKEFLEELRARKATDKDARIQYTQATFYIQLLQEKGTRLPGIIAEHLEDDIWELRPGNNRVFFFYHKDNTYVLLHHFRKKSQKTPRREIDRAKSERDDWKSRKH